MSRNSYSACLLPRTAPASSSNDGAESTTSHKAKWRPSLYLTYIRIPTPKNSWPQSNVNPGSSSKGFFKSLYSVICSIINQGARPSLLICIYRYKHQQHKHVFTIYEDIPVTYPWTARNVSNPAHELHCSYGYHQLRVWMPF